MIAHIFALYSLSLLHPTILLWSLPASYILFLKNLGYFSVPENGGQIPKVMFSLDEHSLLSVISWF